MWHFFFICVFIPILLLIIDFWTNTFDINKYAWDFKYYIAFAKDGFEMKDLISPVAYRYMTPFLASGLHHFLSLSIPEAFKVLSYVGLWLQLSGIYLFIFYYTKSWTGAIIATLITAFSAINVKFLLFDPFRPDIFAYFFVLVAIYLAFKKKFFWLLLVSVIGVQFREYAIVPLITYFVNLLINKEWQEIKRYILPFIFVLVLSVLVPRILIPVTESYQYVKSFRDLFLIPLDVWRDFNWLYTILIYFLPTFILLTRERYINAKENISHQDFTFIVIYTLFIVLLSMYGGTDLGRFTTYLFIPQIILVGFFAKDASKFELIYLLVTVFLFNKIHTDIPVGDFNWYGGYDNIVTSATYTHLLWMTLIIIGAVVLRKISSKVQNT